MRSEVKVANTTIRRERFLGLGISAIDATRVSVKSMAESASRVTLFVSIISMMASGTVIGEINARREVPE